MRAIPVIFVLLSTACGTFVYHRVGPGETLYSISWRYGHDFREVAAWNNIKPPYFIHPGQRLRVAPPSSAQRHLKESGDPQLPPKIVSAGAVGVREGRPARAPSVTRRHRVSWVWPVKGKLLHTFSRRAPGRKGLDIGGRVGTPVRAASTGRVVYSGSGLARYGKLLIIKHDERYLSAYAHNKRLLVKEGDRVMAGQMIAEMGDSGARQVMLHFEIRLDGRPVDPLRYLPRRGY